jgi:hypothetical protein
MPQDHADEQAGKHAPPERNEEPRNVFHYPVTETHGQEYNNSEARRAS